VFRYRRTIGIDIAIEGLRESDTSAQSFARRDRSLRVRRWRVESDGAVHERADAWLRDARYGRVPFGRDY